MSVPPSILERMSAITPTVMVEIEMTTPGAALLLAELYQSRGEQEKAIGLLENLVDVAPDNPAIASVPSGAVRPRRPLAGTRQYAREDREHRRSLG